MKNYAICGVSNRALIMFIEPLLTTFAGQHRIVALLDSDPLRFEVARSKFPALAGVPVYTPEAFDRMLKETGADTVIVSSRDDTHLDYILASLRHDIDVLAEKPMVIHAADAAKVMAAEAASKGKVTVLFNYRYNPIHRRIKEMILSGKVGRVTSVDLNWYVDTFHGSSYFRRWNRNRELSGGLSVHKSTHHFDLVNWWLDQKPQEVFAFGGLNYYGADSEHNPSRQDGRYCETCREREDCSYVMRWSTVDVRDDHLRAEDNSTPKYTNYRTDACIFDSDISIEDTYAATVKYDQGALLSYSINFSAPYEGYRLAINGTLGRIESTEYHEPSRVPFPIPQQTIDYYPLFGAKEIIYVVRGEGGHGGGDPVLLRDLFDHPDKHRGYEILAGAEAGAYSIAAGEAVWLSNREGRAITIEDLLQPVELYKF
ncbi:Gfo/Idh/MocA family protein [Paenibacillus riograndensis]|uniref:Putative oxidoreductase YteT n=3 Tax=Paenibacillus riograndensis TaxID=483937 RepID=A0A0E3WIQ9_9BACL|nr:Gfo/Idh/MocA family oxidoreductase [Paenibacillus riograndensis]CQR57468.1 putative oxidoreductase YteT [Paenibacillus riograndensis SBR5]